jgi:ABC-2 type transport system permease protein
MMSVVRAELRRMLRWPALWVLSGVWALLNLLFAYVFPYLTYRNNGTQVGPRAGAVTLDLLMPAHAPVAAVQGLPMFGGALVLILGALAVGSGYGWGTWKTVFTTGPRRGTVLAGLLGAIGIILAGFAVGTMLLDLGASSIIALAEHRDIVLPSFVDVLRGLGSALLISAMWTVGGVLLGALARGPALAVGLGLVWSLVVENLLRGVGSVLAWLEPVTDLLPGTAAGSLAHAVGALPVTDPNGTPGVNTVWDGPTALLLLIAYVLVFALGTLGLMGRRDLAG